MPCLYTNSSHQYQPDLVVVIPVYNEQDSLPKVINEWVQELEKWCQHFVLLAIDDGSKDSSLEVLHQLQQFQPRLLVITRPNRGHGQTCLEGYQYAATLGAHYIFQIDSDGQCDPRYFHQFWQARHQAMVIYGVRTTRDDGWKRVAISKTLKLMLLLAFRVDCPDANVPYRLMETQAIQRVIRQIPGDFSLANVALAILLRRDKAFSHRFIPIGFRKRYAGEPSVKPSLFGRKAVELYRNIQTMLNQQS